MDDEPIEIPEKLSGTLKKALKRLKTARDSPFEKEYRKKAKENLDYFTTEDQGWDQDGVRAYRKDKSLPTLSLNRIKPVVWLVCGARPTTEYRYAGREAGDVDTAEIMNACKDYVEDGNSWQFTEYDWFKQGLITGRSVIEVLPTYERGDPRGEIQLEWTDGDQWILDPNSKRRDRRDDEFRFRRVRMSAEKAKEMWPNKKEAIDELVQTAEQWGGAPDKYRGREANLADQYDDNMAAHYSTEEKLLTVYYYWYKVPKQYSVVIDLQQPAPDYGPLMIDVPKTPKEVEQDLSQMPDWQSRFLIFPKKFTEVHYLVFCWDIELENGTTPWLRPDGRWTELSTTFPQVIFESERVIVGSDHKLITFIEDLKDPQRFYNKLASAVIQIISGTAATGVDFEEGSISAEQETVLAKYGQMHADIKWSKGAIAENRFRRRTPPQTPTAHITVAQQMASEVIDISGTDSLVNTQALGKGASGYAIDLKQRQGGNIISWVYTSFSAARYILSAFIRDGVQVLFDHEKVLRIKGRTGTQHIRINEAIYDEAGSIQQVLNDVTIGQYDVVQIDKDVMPTMRMERLKAFVELARNGVLPVPPEIMLKIIMELMDDPGLRRIIEEEMSEYMEALRQQTQANLETGNVPQLPAPPGSQAIPQQAAA